MRLDQVVDPEQVILHFLGHGLDPGNHLPGRLLPWPGIVIGDHDGQAPGNQLLNRWFLTHNMGSDRARYW